MTSGNQKFYYESAFTENSSMGLFLLLGEEGLSHQSLPSKIKEYRYNTQERGLVGDPNNSEHKPFSLQSHGTPRSSRTQVTLQKLGFGLNTKSELLKPREGNPFLSVVCSGRGTS